MTAAEALRRAISEAARALAHRVYERDQLAEDDRTDPYAFALDYLNAQVGHGWRPTNAQKNAWTSAPLRDNTETNNRGMELARQSLNRKSDTDKGGYHDAGPD
ncbi:hypothetical protein [Nonomuraea basaltis]|uniref:hypothetical protein n=1 Tax=Nonomuraea basaltis TaxID=2495887 RepID=UPI00110C4937|nr:hypothetical protein [Nonomuraea basaltis]TMR99548.1 hypothetical protein EJK15_06975 [Nonomuraea basaltis]